MKFSILLVIICFAITAEHFSQNDSKIIGGNSLSVVLPQETLAETYDLGIGFYGHLDYNFSEVLAFRADLGYNSLSGEEKEYIDTGGNIHVNHPEVTIWEITVGLKAQFSIFYIEGRTGYFSSVNTIGFVPAAGIRLGNFDLQGNYVFAGDDKFAAVRFAWYWAKE